MAVGWVVRNVYQLFNCQQLKNNTKMTAIDDVRTVHMVEGSTFVEYLSFDSSYLTAGADGKVNVYPALFDDESLSIALETKITGLTVKDKFVVLSNEKHEVKLYKLPDMKFNSTLLRFTAAVNHVSICNNKDIVAAGASDFIIKTVSVDGNNQQTYSGHSAPVLSVQFFGSQKLISSSCDGTVKIWNLDDQKCIKTLDILPKSNSPPRCPGVISVCAPIQKVAVPSAKSVKILSCETWEEEFSMENEHKETVSNVCWSPNGKYLATSSNSGEIFCWEMSSKTCIKRYQQQESKGITCLQWKKSNEVVFADEEGEFGVCEMPADEVQIKGDELELDDDDDILASALLEDDHDEETNDGEIFSTASAKKSKKRPLAMDDDDDDEYDGNLKDNEGGPSSKKTRINNMDNFLDDQAEDDDGDEASISLNLIKEGLMEPIRKSVIDEDDDDVESLATVPNQKAPTTTVVQAEVLMQPAFQPSSTPVHLQHRFMVWNSTGIIRCHRDDGVSSIDVEFHNASTSHPLHIANVLDNTMAALSGTAVVFACKKQDDIPSKLTCTHFGSWDNNREWSMSMNKDEDIMAIAANVTHVVAATSRSLLRILSVSGLQVQLLYLPGPVVSISMHEKEMTVIYHKSAGYKKCQCLGITQYEYKKMNWKISSDETMNLQANVTVVWLGYSTEGTPSIVLSSGDVLLFHRTQRSWVVVGNTKEQVKNRSDNYWVISIEETQAQMRCIYCKGANFPALLPRPIPTFIGFQFPLCEKATEKSKKEHELMKNKLLQSNMSYSLNSLRLPIEHSVEATERQQMQLLMQLFALACKADRDFRAVEICKLMPSAESIGLAIQYASKMRRMNIAKRLTELAQLRAAKEEQEEEEENEDEEFNDLSDLSDGEQEVIHAAKHSSTPAISKNRIRGSMRQHQQQQSQNTKPATTMELSEDEENEEIESEEENSENISQQKSSQIENSAPKPRLSGNPFKVSQSSAVKTGGAKGTDYFEKLESQKLSKTKQVKKNINDAVKKKQNKITATKLSAKTNKKKNENESVKENIDFNVAEKVKPKPLTGFQLFLNKQQESRTGNGEDDEDFVPVAMKMWKELTPDEKKDWNTKAKEGQIVKSQQQIIDVKNSNHNNSNVTPNDVAEKKNIEKKTKIVSAKSKLSSFAFQKT